MSRPTLKPLRKEDVQKFREFLDAMMAEAEENDYWDDDYDHYIVEEVINTFYNREDVWDFIASKMR